MSVEIKKLRPNFFPQIQTFFRTRVAGQYDYFAFRCRNGELLLAVWQLMGTNHQVALTVQTNNIWRTDKLRAIGYPGVELIDPRFSLDTHSHICVLASLVHLGIISNPNDIKEYERQTRER